MSDSQQAPTPAEQKPTGPRAEAADVPLIGGMIDKATNGEVVYKDIIDPTTRAVIKKGYSGDQTLGRPDVKELKSPDDPRQFIGIEAAEAAMLTHKVSRETVYGLLIEQGDIRQTKVLDDMPKVLAGEKLGGLDPVKIDMKTGRVQMGQLYMSDAPVDGNVKTAADKVKVAEVQDIRNDNRWKAVEGLVSNPSNAIKDMEKELDNRPMTADGHLTALTPKEIATVNKGLNAEVQIQGTLEAGKVMRKHGLFFMNSEDKQVHRLDKAMDVAAKEQGIKLDDPIYKHYKEDMNKNIHDGFEAARELHNAGVTIAKDPASGLPTFQPAVQKDTGPALPKK